MGYFPTKILHRTPKLTIISDTSPDRPILTLVRVPRCLWTPATERSPPAGPGPRVTAAQKPTMRVQVF